VTLDELVAEFIAAKHAETQATEKRTRLEQQILALSPAKEEGSSTVTLASGMKLTVTGKLTYSVDDMDALREITRGWDGNLVPLKTSTAIDAAGCKYLRAERPELWAQLARVVSVKPAKTALTVKAA
jgi:hypothetical protein